MSKIRCTVVSKCWGVKTSRAYHQVQAVYIKAQASWVIYNVVRQLAHEVILSPLQGARRTSAPPAAHGA